MTSPDPGLVLRRALIAWGLGHLALGRTVLGWAWLAAEVAGLAVVVWLTVGLIDSSAYLVPFFAGVAFLVTWAWQAVDAYRTTRSVRPAGPRAARSAAAAMGWLSLPLLVWGTGFWLVAARSATPAAALDRFVTAWTGGDLDAGWPAHVRGEAERAANRLGQDDNRFADLRFRLIERCCGALGDERRVGASVERIHYERRDARFLGVLPGTELVPVPDEVVLGLWIEATPVELPGGGDIGAVRWQVVWADVPDLQPSP